MNRNHCNDGAIGVGGIQRMTTSNTNGAFVRSTQEIPHSVFESSDYLKSSLDAIGCIAIHPLESNEKYYVNFTTQRLAMATFNLSPKLTEQETSCNKITEKDVCEACAKDEPKQHILTTHAKNAEPNRALSICRVIRLQGRPPMQRIHGSL